MSDGTSSGRLSSADASAIDEPAGSDGRAAVDDAAALDETAEVEGLPVEERAEAYLRAERALQERLGIGGP